MQLIGQAKKVTIYIDESDKWHHQPLSIAILEMLKAQGCAGATVTRGIAGFGAHSRIHTASLVALSADLPLIVEWVDSPHRVNRVMPTLQAMVTEGLITVQDVDVAFYSQRNLHQIPTALLIHDIMCRDVHAIQLDAPLLHAIEMLLDKIYRALPVVDAQNQVVGILTEGDLLRKLDILATSTQQQLTSSEISAIISRLQRIDRRVSQMMTAKPITIESDTTVPHALNLMITYDIKRLPVLDTQGKLVGMVSRVDILRAISSSLVAEDTRQSISPGSYTLVKEVMLTTVPTVQAHAPLAEIVELLVTNNHRRVIVVDNQEVVGLITDGDLINRAMPNEHPSIIQTLSHHLSPQKAILSQRTTSQVMTTPVITVTPNTPLTEALHLLLEHHIKRLPVVDETGALVGLIGRGGILQAFGKNIKLNVPN